MKTGGDGERGSNWYCKMGDVDGEIWGERRCQCMKVNVDERILSFMGGLRLCVICVSIWMREVEGNVKRMIRCCDNELARFCGVLGVSRYSPFESPLKYTRLTCPRYTK